MGPIFSFIIWLIVAALVIWLVARMNIGLEVRGFGAAAIAALVIAAISAVAVWLLSLFGLGAMTGILGAIISIIVAALVLMFAGAILPGLKVNGFNGAIVAAIAIGVVGWLITWALGLFGVNVAM